MSDDPRRRGGGHPPPPPRRTGGRAPSSSTPQYGGPSGGPSTTQPPASQSGSRPGSQIGTESGSQVGPQTGSGSQVGSQPRSNPHTPGQQFIAPVPGTTGSSGSGQLPPPGTPYSGDPTAVGQRKTTPGGSTAFSAQNKVGQYLEVIYPAAFFEINRKTCATHFESKDLNIYYKSLADPNPPDPQELVQMKTKLDRLARKILVVYGQPKFGCAAIKELFPGLDSRVFTFAELYKDWNRNFGNLKRKLMWEDCFGVALEWVSDYPREFRVDTTEWAQVNENMTHTRRWIYAQVSENLYKRAFAVVYEVMPWADNFSDRGSVKFFFLKTLMAGILQKIGPIAAAELKLNPGVKWAKRGVKWNLDKDARTAASDFLEWQSTDQRFLYPDQIDLDTFTFAEFADDQRDTPGRPSEAPKRRLEDLRRQNPFISDSPPPSPPHKAVGSPALGSHRHTSPGIFDSPRGVRGQSYRPRQSSPLLQAQDSRMFGIEETIDPSLRRDSRGGYPSASGSRAPPGGGSQTGSMPLSNTPRATRTNPSAPESIAMQQARLERENRDWRERESARMREEMQREMASQMQQQLAGTGMPAYGQQQPSNTPQPHSLSPYTSRQQYSSGPFVGDNPELGSRLGSMFGFEARPHPSRYPRYESPSAAEWGPPDELPPHPPRDPANTRYGSQPPSNPGSSRHGTRSPSSHLSEASDQMSNLNLRASRSTANIPSRSPTRQGSNYPEQPLTDRAPDSEGSGRGSSGCGSSGRGDGGQSSGGDRGGRGGPSYMRGTTSSLTRSDSVRGSLRQSARRGSVIPPSEQQAQGRGRSTRSSRRQSGQDPETGRGGDSGSDTAREFDDDLLQAESRESSISPSETARRFVALDRATYH